MWFLGEVGANSGQVVRVELPPVEPELCNFAADCCARALCELLCAKWDCVEQLPRFSLVPSAK